MKVSILVDGFLQDNIFTLLSVICTLLELACCSMTWQITLELKALKKERLHVF
jgi:hypothetical protein